MWFLPTFNRPARCQETLDSIIAVGAGTPGIVFVDGGEAAGYAKLRLPECWRLCVGTANRGLLASLNHLFARYPAEPWYGLINDDHIVRTRGWDKRLIEIAATFGIAVSNDGWLFDTSRAACGAMVFGGELLRALGLWSPPGLWHTYADNFWLDLDAVLHNRHRVADVVVEHRHRLRDPSLDDATYAHGCSHVAEDHRVYQEFRRTEFAAAVGRVRLAIIGAKKPERTCLKR